MIAFAPLLAIGEATMALGESFIAPPVAGEASSVVLYFLIILQTDPLSLATSNLTS